MKKIIISVVTLLALSSLVQANQKMEELVDNKCGICHLSGKLSKEKLQRMAAPPMWGVAKKIKTNLPNKQDGIAFLIDFTMNPSKEKMMFPQETIDKFGHMPSQKGNLTDAELKAIAEYILSK